jgi:hypothetical protein
MGHIRWLMFPHVTFPDAATVDPNCLFPPEGTRYIASVASTLATLVGHAPPSISAGTVILAAKSAVAVDYFRQLVSRTKLVTKSFL